MNGQGNHLSEETFRALMQERLDQQTRDHHETHQQLNSIEKKLDEWIYRIDKDIDRTEKKANTSGAQAKIALAGVGIILTTLLAMLTL